jgi:hypothetical protein
MCSGLVGSESCLARSPKIPKSPGYLYIAVALFGTYTAVLGERNFLLLVSASNVRGVQSHPCL